MMDAQHFRSTLAVVLIGCALTLSGCSHANPLTMTCTHEHDIDQGRTITAKMKCERWGADAAGTPELSDCRIEAAGDVKCPEGTMKDENFMKAFKTDCHDSTHKIQ